MSAKLTETEKNFSGAFGQAEIPRKKSFRFPVYASLFPLRNGRLPKPRRRVSGGAVFPVFRKRGSQYGFQRLSASGNAHTRSGSLPYRRRTEKKQSSQPSYPCDPRSYRDNNVGCMGIFLRQPPIVNRYLRRGFRFRNSGSSCGGRKRLRKSTLYSEKQKKQEIKFRSGLRLRLPFSDAALCGVRFLTF